MSKNLVKVNKFYEHPYYVESDTKNIYIVERLTPEVGVHHISGPAIDRLYKFEQLGMEPEEIKELIGSHKNSLILLDKKDEEINALKDQITNKKDVEIKALKGQIDGMNQTIDKLREENHELEEDIAALQEKNEKISGDNDLYRFKNEHLTKLVNKYCDNKRGLEAQIENLKLELDAKNKTIDSLREELKKYDGFSFKDIIEENDRLEKESSDLIRKHFDDRHLEDENKELREELNKANEYIKELEDTDWIAVCKKQEAQIDELESENLQLSNVLNHTEAKLHKFISDKETGDTIYRTSIKYEIEGRKKLEAENNKLKDKLKKAEGHIVNWQKKCGEIRSELNKELSSFELRNEDLMKMNDELEERNIKLSDELNTMKLKHKLNESFGIYELVGNLKAENDDLMIQNVKLKHELKKNNAEHQLTIDNFIISNNALKDRIVQLERMTINRLETENKDLKAKLETINILSDLRTGKFVDIVTAGPGISILMDTEKIKELTDNLIKCKQKWNEMCESLRPFGDIDEMHEVKILHPDEINKLFP